MHNGIWIFFLLALTTGLTAQEMSPDTTLELRDVTISSSRIDRFAKGQSVVVPDSLTRYEYPAAALSELINGFTSSYSRNYGPGTLSTLSIRGTSANHTGLLWNGIQISPPNIGYLDLSLVQPVFFNSISLLYGGSSPMFGSGLIGGAINLENRPVFRKRSLDAGIGLSAGSFRTYAAKGKVEASRGKFYSRTAFSLLNAVNDFGYTDPEGERVRSGHGSIFRPGFLQDLAVQLPGDQYLMASLWFQYASRDIPPTLMEEVSKASQTDRSWRSMISWKDYNRRNTLEARIAYFNEFTRYEDPLYSIFSDIESQTLNAAFESTWEAGRNSVLFAGARFLYENADLDYYDQPHDQQNLAIYASFRHHFQSLKWQASVNARQEFLADYSSPFLFSAGAEGKIWKLISGRFNISRNFRAPTFNERFWVPGGNPDLEPEESWNEEAAIIIGKKYSSADLNFSLTGYNSRVKNWILWVPGPSYWSVENAQEVWSRGFEINGSQEVNAGNFRIFFSESYTFSKSTNEKKLSDPDASYKKQLIYTPLHRFLVKAGTIFRGYNFTLRGSYTGEVYTTNDNENSLPPYFLLDAVVSKSLNIRGKYPIAVQINLNNIFNNEYVVVPYRPMPGFGLMVTVRAGFIGDVDGR